MKNKTNFSNDQIREEILKFLYDVRKKARSIQSMAVTISKIKIGLKPQGITQNDVVTNLDYLVQNKWVIQNTEHRTFKSTSGMEFSSDKTTYRLSDEGIKYFEKSSTFDKTSRFSGINIQNVQGVVVLGNNNVVRQEYLDMFRKLEELENKMKISSELEEDQKLSAQVDIQTIKDQLAKPLPDKQILKSAVEALSILASIPGLVEFFNGIKGLIENIFK